ncbi:unnamed protein product [Lactuca virosa]|uniref:Diacylglycerol O-acyltransferase n=1 Tax=Lactuca virosa TaxID=75947 RepID=A0AAU9N781_9ASTR|nr:unnamed protein product [Lactuca virosa]
MGLRVKVGGLEDVVLSEPVSPTGQYFNSSVLSISILCILEFENPFDDSSRLALINDVFLPINPRFSSIMVENKQGGKHWKRVEVNAEDHIKIPCFPEGLAPESYDHYFDDYLSKMAIDPLPQTKPLWEIHIIKYPISNASGNVIFKLHHSLGDGYSLMCALLSCLQRADNPSLPLTLPIFRKSLKPEKDPKSIISRVPQALTCALNTVMDFGWSILKSSVLEDRRSLIHSGNKGVEFNPINITTITFSLDQIKQIKSCLHVTVNDVICGIIFLGTRLYMDVTSEGAKMNGQQPWCYLTQDLLMYDGSLKPLKFVQEIQSIIKTKRNSAAVYLTGMLLEFMRKYRGPEATAQYVHNTIRNSSMAVTNMIGPVEKMALSNQPVKGLYFMVVNSPKSLVVTIMSYMDHLRVTIGTETGLIDPVKFRTCTEKAFSMIFDAAVKSK